MGRAKTTISLRIALMNFSSSACRESRRNQFNMSVAGLIWNVDLMVESPQTFGTFYNKETREGFTFLAASYSSRYCLYKLFFSVTCTINEQY